MNEYAATSSLLPQSGARRSLGQATGSIQLCAGGCFGLSRLRRANDEAAVAGASVLAALDELVRCTHCSSLLSTGLDLLEQALLWYRYRLEEGQIKIKTE